MGLAAGELDREKQTMNTITPKQMKRIYDVVGRRHIDDGGIYQPHCGAILIWDAPFTADAPCPIGVVYLDWIKCSVSWMYHVPPHTQEDLDAAWKQLLAEADVAESN
jgi:hypothetical protein